MVRGGGRRHAAAVGSHGLGAHHLVQYWRGGSVCQVDACRHTGGTGDSWRAGEVVRRQKPRQMARRQKRRLAGGAASGGFVSAAARRRASAQCLGACRTPREVAGADRAATAQARHATHLRTRSCWRRPLLRVAGINGRLRRALPGAAGLALVQPALQSRQQPQQAPFAAAPSLFLDRPQLQC